METVTWYRLRWQYPGGSRTRYFAREHFATKAADRYRLKGYQVSLDSSEMLPVAAWAPWQEEPVAVMVCANCGDEVEMVQGELITVDGGWPRCFEDQDTIHTVR